MKIGIFQDIHANLPAFEKGVEFFKKHKCSLIFHVGDLIGIGPYPKETVELASSIREMKFIMGNHDYWYAYGLPNPIPDSMNEEEVEHHHWTHKQLGGSYKALFKQWGFAEKLEFSNNQTVVFQHYGFNAIQRWFKPHIQFPTDQDLDELFKEVDSTYIFYGHNHLASDIKGKSRYVNLGSAGCYDKAEVRLGILEASENNFILRKFSIPYEDNGLMSEYEKRSVPAKDFIKKVFITRA